MEVFVGSNKLHTPKPEETKEKLKIQFDFLEITKEDPSLKFSLSHHVSAKDCNYQPSKNLKGIIVK